MGKIINLNNNLVLCMSLKLYIFFLKILYIKFIVLLVVEMVIWYSIFLNKRLSLLCNKNLLVMSFIIYVLVV